MFSFSTDSQSISLYPITINKLADLQSSSSAWRACLLKYKLSAYLCIGVPLIFIATVASWSELFFSLVIGLGCILFAEFHIQSMLSEKHNVSLKVDDLEFAKPHDKKYLGPISSTQMIHTESDASCRYMKNLKTLNRYVTYLDVDIINYLNSNGKKNG